MRPLLSVLALLALSGCDVFDSLDDETEGIRLTVQTADVAPGGEALAVLDNDSGRAVAYGCPRLGRVVDGVFVPTETSSFCTDILVSVEDSETVVFRVQIPVELGEGLYAVAVDVGRDAPEHAVTSGDFRVSP